MSIYVQKIVLYVNTTLRFEGTDSRQTESLYEQEKLEQGKVRVPKKKNRGRAVHFYNDILLLYSLLVLNFNCLQTTLQQITPEQYHHDSLQALIFLSCFLTKRTSSAIILTVHMPGTSEKGSVELFPGIVTKAGSLLGGKTISLL